MNKRSAKFICFAISMNYSVCPVQVLIERFSRKPMKYAFNHCFAIVGNDKLLSRIKFSENVLAPSLSASSMAAW